MRVFTWIWIVFLVICLFLDGSNYFIARFRISYSLEEALEGALTAAVDEEDLRWGSNSLNETRGLTMANILLMDNLGTYYMDKVNSDIHLYSQGQKIYAKGIIEATIPLYISGAVGLNAKIKVNKTIDYAGTFK